MSVQSSSNEEAAKGTDVPEGVDSRGEDNALILRAQQNDGAAFDRLVQKHANRLLRMVRNLTSQREDAEDIVQETFAAAYFKLDTFAGRSSFFTWLYRIALNKAISRRRLRRIETTHSGRGLDDAPQAVDPAVSPNTKLEHQEQIERMRAAIARLEPDRQSVLVLRDVDGHDYGEIANILNIPVGTVRSRLHRARCDLRSLLEAEGWSAGGQDA